MKNLSFEAVEALVIDKLEWRNSLSGSKAGQTQFGPSFGTAFNKFSHSFAKNYKRILDFVVELVALRTRDVRMQFLTATICKTFVIREIRDSPELALKVSQYMQNNNWDKIRANQLRKSFISPVLEKIEKVLSLQQKTSRQMKFPVGEVKAASLIAAILKKYDLETSEGETEETKKTQRNLFE